MNIIVDATNINVKSRRNLLDIVRNKENVNKVAYVMTTPIAVCKRQNRARARTVPEEVIDRQIGKFEIPFYEEGFDTINLIGWNFNQFEVIVPQSNWTTDDDYIMSLMKGFDQKNQHHIYDVLTHTSKVIENVPPVYPLKAAALFHDIGKPKTFTVDEKGTGHFYGHNKVSARITNEILTKLKAPG